MQAIVVKYLPPTNSRGSRLKASAFAGSITIPYPYGVSESAGPRLAADALCEKLGGRTRGWWADRLVEGTLPNGDRVFVSLPNGYRLTDA